MEPTWYRANKLNLSRVQPTILADWLIAPDSLTQRLRQFIGASVEIKIMRESWQLPLASERMLLNLTLNTPVWVREVVLTGGKHQLIYARSVFPTATLATTGKLLQKLGERSLGDFLFTDPTWHRDPFQIARLQCQDYLLRRIKQIVNKNTATGWVRRSRFYFHQQPLLITEVFLPDLLQQLKPTNLC